MISSIAEARTRLALRGAVTRLRGLTDLPFDGGAGAAEPTGKKH